MSAPRLTRRRVVIGALVVFAIGLAAAAAIALFGGSTPSSAAGLDNGSPITLLRVSRRDLSSQTEVSATLGYADPATVVQPTGTEPSALQQAQQAVTTSAGQEAAARAGLAADSATLEGATALLAADRQKLSVDCAGDQAGQAPSAPSQGASGANAGSGGSGGCAADAQSVSSGQDVLAQAQAKVATDRQSVASASAALASARAAVTAAQASATSYGPSSTYTQLPAVGAIVRVDGVLYEISGEPVVLLYGQVAPWRAFVPGMSPGRDVAELNRNLEALGFGASLGGDAYTGSTVAAVKRFQAAHGLPATGSLLLGSVVFAPSAIRVTAVTPTVGAAVQPGPVLTTTSLAREVTIALDAGQQTDVAVGDPVTITLPDNSTTPGRVTYVGTVATTPPSSDQGGGGGTSSPTIEVDVTPTDPAATGKLDQAPVSVSITTGQVHGALVVPVNALLALASGGYAVEVVGAGGVHHLVAVRTGLFDDADGYVQVTSSGLAAGQRVVVPSE
ncbi:MAG TPA: peptidoglycan-binding protein [Gaiellaceae bacterium]|nr:peptidoglycan-binding protein [Gaiellaceae bacterium]